MDVDLDLREEGNLFSVCAPGGCDAQLSGDQKAVMKRLHTSLAVLVKRFDPAKQNISALPLTLLWESAKEGVGVATVLGFRTYTANLDMIWLEMQLESSNRSDLTYGLQPPYILKFKTHLDGTAAYFNEMSLCVTLASISDDWTVRLDLGGPGKLETSTRGQRPRRSQKMKKDGCQNWKRKMMCGA